MCGILGVVAKTPVNQLLYDGLLVLQHRGQDAAGIVTADGNKFQMHKGGGLVRDVFRTRDMRHLVGNMASRIAAIRRPVPLPRSPKPSRSMSILRLASCWGITAISPTQSS